MPILINTRVRIEVGEMGLGFCLAFAVRCIFCFVSWLGEATVGSFKKDWG